MALYDIPEDGDISYPDDVIGIDLGGRHYHCNSDAFSHHVWKWLRDIPDEVFELQDEYFQSDKFKPWKQKTKAIKLKTTGVEKVFLHTSYFLLNKVNFLINLNFHKILLKLIYLW